MELKNIIVALLIAASVATTEANAAGGPDRGYRPRTQRQLTFNAGVLEPRDSVYFQQLTAGMVNREDINHVTAAFQSIPPACWHELRTRVEPLFTHDMGSIEKADIISALSDVPVANWAAVLAQLPRFITDDMDGWNRRCVIGAVLIQPIDQLPAFHAQVQHFFTPDMNGTDKAHIIANVGKISHESWAAFQAQAEQFITPAMDGGDKSEIIGGFAKALEVVPEEHWTAFTSQAKRLISPTMDGNDIGQIITALDGIPQAELVDRVNRASNPENYNPAQDNLNRLTLILATPLTEPVPSRRGGGIVAVAATTMPTESTL